MPLQILNFRPGVSRESTDLANSGGWYTCDKIRFRSGFPQKIGGWVSFVSGTMLGICRHLVDWESQSLSYLVGLGTNLKYYITTGGIYYDVTPIRLTLTGTNPFSTICTTLTASIAATDTTLPVVYDAEFDWVTPMVITICRY
jgi:hypothetical protein